MAKVLKFLLVISLLSSNNILALEINTNNTGNNIEFGNINYSSDIIGNIKGTYWWTDKKGNNILVISQLENIDSNTPINLELFAYHFIKTNNKYNLIRKVYDFIDNCSEDSELSYLKNPVTISDINNDGYYEFSLTYEKQCTGDISPSIMKVLLFEKNKKYALRGLRIVTPIWNMAKSKKEKDALINEGWGKYDFDKEFKNAPDGFIEFADKIWQEHVFMIYK